MMFLGLVTVCTQWYILKANVYTIQCFSSLLQTFSQATSNLQSAMIVMQGRHNIYQCTRVLSATRDNHVMVQQEFRVLIPFGFFFFCTNGEHCVHIIVITEMEGQIYKALVIEQIRFSSPLRSWGNL